MKAKKRCVKMLYFAIKGIPLTRPNYGKLAGNLCRPGPDSVVSIGNSDVVMDRI